MPVTDVEKDVDALTMTITADGKPEDGGPIGMTVTIAEADGTLNKVDPLLGAARA